MEVEENAVGVEGDERSGHGSNVSTSASAPVPTRIAAPGLPSARRSWNARKTPY